MEINEKNLTEEKRILTSKMREMLFLDKEILLLFQLVDGGYNASDVIRVLELYDLTETEQKLYAINEIKDHTKLKQILSRLNGGNSLIFKELLRSND